MSKVQSGLNANTTIREAIQKIALHGVINPKTNTTYSNEGVSGYVVKVHLDDEMAGTVDVKEYSNTILSEEGGNIHEGVLLSAIQGNTGLLVVPKLYSDVLIAKDPVTNLEYVTMFSHVDVLQLDSHDTITIGVKEREEFDESSEDGDDINELPETGVHAVTKYQKDSITTEVTDGEDNTTTQKIDTEKFEIISGDDKSKQIINQDGVSIEHDDSKMILDNDKSVLEKGKSKVQIEDGTVYLGSTSGTDDAVLGGELADILMDFLGYLAQGQTTTQLGPQPMINQVPNFIALKAKIQSFKAAHSGFLTNKVLVQK